MPLTKQDVKRDAAASEAADAQRSEPQADEASPADKAGEFWQTTPPGSNLSCNGIEIEPAGHAADPESALGMQPVMYRLRRILQTAEMSRGGQHRALWLRWSQQLRPHRPSLLLVRIHPDITTHIGIFPAAGQFCTSATAPGRVTRCVIIMDRPFSFMQPRMRVLSRKLRKVSNRRRWQRMP